MRSYLLLFFCMLVSNPVFSASWGSDCSYETKTFTVTMPSGIKISIDPNAPIGTVFFEYYVSGQLGQKFKCNTPGNFMTQGGYIYGEGGQTVTMSGGGLTSQSGATYPVFKTNVPGIGLIARFSSNAFPRWWNAYSYTNQVLDYTNAITQVFDINIVKYGDIPTGANTINIDSTVISSIDSISRVSNSSNTSRLPNGDVVMARFVLSPVTIDILTATCDTPDVPVNLGLRKLTETSYREGGYFATPWVNASIQLVNCPVFYGTGQRGNYKGITRNNVMTVTLIPNNATTSTQGIMPIDHVAGAATGVGIQMAWGTSASPQLVNFAGKGTNTYTMSSSQGANYTVPLVARYMQTTASISDVYPGKANGKVTYLIDYY